MQEITFITPDFAVTGSLTAADFSVLRAMGFKSIISNLPDDETGETLPAIKAAQIAKRHGLEFRHIPADKLDLFSKPVVDAVAAVLRDHHANDVLVDCIDFDKSADLQGPVLAYCKSGMRSAIIWGAACARNQPIDRVMTALAAAGFDFDFLEEDFAAQSEHGRPASAAALSSAGHITKHSSASPCV